MENNASVQLPGSHQDKKQLSSEDKLRNKRRKRGKKNSSSQASGHRDNTHKNSSDAMLAEQPKLKKKKTPAQVTRDCAIRKAHWKIIIIARKLRAENLAAHNVQLQETKTAASPHVSVPVVSHPENYRCLETKVVSESNRHLTIEGGTVSTAQVQSDLHALSAEAAESEKSSILDTSDELEFRK